MAKKKKAKTKKNAQVRKWTARELLDLLVVKHEKDVFVPECKDGPTWKGSHLRMDAWAMRRSWSKPCVTAYEIKVSRSDFTSDKKWHGAFQCCNEFFFVCPPGLIKPDELPDEAGLIWGSMNGTRLFTKKRPKHRPDVEIPECLYRYILMARVKIVKDSNWYQGTEEDKASYWRRWLKKKEEDRDIGWQVSRALSRKYSEEVVRVQTNQLRLDAEIKRLNAFKKIAEKLQLCDWDMDKEESVVRRVNALKAVFPKWLIKITESTAKNMMEAAEYMRQASDGKIEV